MPNSGLTSNAARTVRAENRPALPACYRVVAAGLAAIRDARQGLLLVLLSRCQSHPARRMTGKWFFGSLPVGARLG